MVGLNVKIRWLINVSGTTQNEGAEKTTGFVSLAFVKVLQGPTGLGVVGLNWCLRCGAPRSPRRFEIWSGMKSPWRKLGPHSPD